MLVSRRVKSSIEYYRPLILAAIPRKPLGPWIRALEIHISVMPALSENQVAAYLWQDYVRQR